MQALFLPLFTLFPPIMWAKLLFMILNKEFKVKPRGRPVGDTVPDFEVHIFFSRCKAIMYLETHFLTGSGANGANSLGYYCIVADSRW